MSVYVIRRKGDENGPCKIGFSGDVGKRLNDMATANPGGFDVLKVIAGGRGLERRLHGQFASHRIAGEWFLLRSSDLQKIAEMPDEEDPLAGRSYPLPAPEDESSEDILLETRFYLNELVKREWNGMGDTIEAARDRVVDRLEIEASYGARLWTKPTTMKGVNGEPYRRLQLAYAIECFRENRLTERQVSALRWSMQGFKEGSELLPTFEMEFNAARQAAETER